MNFHMDFLKTLQTYVVMGWNTFIFGKNSNIRKFKTERLTNSYFIKLPSAFCHKDDTV